MQLDFIIRRWAAMAESDQSKRNVQPYKAVVEKDTAWLRGFENHVPEILRGLGEAFTEMTPEHEYRNGQLFRMAKMLGTIDNGPGKPAHIFAQTGRLPVLAGGNSDGDIEMLECARFGLLNLDYN